MPKDFVAVTGGIGSGKSYVCQLLGKRGIDVYDCDAAAQRLMRSSEQLRTELQRLVGPEVYQGTVLQKPVLRKYILESDAHKQAVNDIVHPAVASDFLASGQGWLESAILFESGFYRRLPFRWVICVDAPLELRWERIMRRSAVSLEVAQKWTAGQMDAREVARRSDFVISNDGHSDLEYQIDNILKRMNYK